MTQTVITYLPQGKAHFTRQRIIIPDGLSPDAQAACRSDVAAF
jgi:hypothetical protein